jgi:hypothetical protein
MTHPYRVNPFCGVICSVCQYTLIPSRKKSFSITDVLNHERRNDKHSRKSTKDERVAIVDQMLREMNEIAVYICNLRKDNEEAAIEELYKYLCLPQVTLPFCSQCQSIVAKPCNHKGGKHWEYCTEQRSGYIIKDWERNDPGFVPYPLKIDDVSVFCPTFQRYYEEASLSTTTNNTNVDIAVVTAGLLKLQQCSSQRTPNAIDEEEEDEIHRLQERVVWCESQLRKAKLALANRLAARQAAKNRLVVEEEDASVPSCFLEPLDESRGQKRGADHNSQEPLPDDVPSSQADTATTTNESRKRARENNDALPNDDDDDDDAKTGVVETSTWKWWKWRI